MNKLSIEDLDVKGQRVLLRVDFNVPLDENQRVADSTRIVSVLPTIKYLLKEGARLILVSHLGRPKGTVSDKLSLRPVAEVLGNLLKKQVYFSPALIGPVAQSAIDCLKNGDCLLMENVRFYQEEEKNDVQFSKELASLADKYVNDAFGTAHRAHASTEGVARYFEDAACGFLMKKELEFLGNLAGNPKRPFCAIIGGAKVKDKIHVISRLLDKADDILIGGGMAYSFLRVQGKEIGKSILDAEHLGWVEEAFEKAETVGRRIHLPVDHVVSQEFADDAPNQVVDVDIPSGYMGMDIGPQTVRNYISVIEKAKTTFWNGPMGVFEMKSFQNGTFEIAGAMAAADAVTVVGGGDSVAAVNRIDKAGEMSHVSTGGGASLEFIEGKNLPGIEALAEKK
ncbi:MAG: phosphoglycerate kinase [Proteobacteria bacterium]|nr:phosphoglycerate kinase [Pseudomonadota bacterium]